MHHLNRRQWIQAAATAVILPPIVDRVLTGSARAADAPGFTLPKLPYAFDALEPNIDAKTMEIHHDKHHAAYVANLNKALADHPDLLNTPIDGLMRNLDKLPLNPATRTAVRNNGGGHCNHSHFWTWMAPKGGGEPTGPLGDAIKSAYGDFAKFRGVFKEAAMKQFGSGWAWLIKADGKVMVTSSPNQDTPLSEGKTPLLGIDVWEHAYYLKYQNRRADYIDNWWNVVNWKPVAERFAAHA
jgi:superoxide dismutase, Fe-Mn family